MRKKIIENITNTIHWSPKIFAAILIDSYGRNEQNALSDIAIQLFTSDDFDEAEFDVFFQNHFNEKIDYNLILNEQNKIIYYITEDFICLEFLICKNLKDINKHFLYSEIKDIDHCIIFDKKEQLRTYLYEITIQFKEQTDSHKKLLNENIQKFLYHFEKCSAAEAKNDAYKFYFQYNIALQQLIQLRYFTSGHINPSYIPSHFHRKLIKREKQKDFFSLSGVLYLEEANAQKRKLLEFFYETLEMINETFGIIANITEIAGFCENVFKRDFLWNFRDAAKFNNQLYSGMLFRSSSPTNYQDSPEFTAKLKRLNIKLIIDLRGNSENDTPPYKSEFLSNFEYANIPLEPLKKMNLDHQEYKNGTLYEKAYRFFALECKNEIKQIFEAVENILPAASLIHCAAGKDRTGFVVSLFHLLVDAPESVVFNDYLASASDTEPQKIAASLEIIKRYGSFSDYLSDCGISLQTIENLKNNLKRSNKNNRKYENS